MKFLVKVNFSIVLIINILLNVYAQEPQLKTEEQIEKDLFPTVMTRGIAPVKLGSTPESTTNGQLGSAQTNVAGKVDLQAITFEYNSAVLTSAAKAQLQRVAAVLHTKDLVVHSFELIGHTDAAGSNEYNKSLSERRAKSAADFLFVDQNIPANGFKVYGVGESRLANPEEPLSADNRRVEIVRLN